MVDLFRLLNPTSIAFVGGNECAIAITRTRELGFVGKIWAVHPTREHLGGVVTVKSVADISGPIDAAFIAVKREPTVEIVRQLAAKNCAALLFMPQALPKQAPVNCKRNCWPQHMACPCLAPIAMALSTRFHAAPFGPMNTGWKFESVAWPSSRNLATLPATLA